MKNYLIFIGLICAMTFLWIYLFLPFRLFGLPALYGQTEEWTFSACLSILSRFQKGFRLKAGYKTDRFALILFLFVAGFISFSAIRHLVNMKKMRTHPILN